MPQDHLRLPPQLHQRNVEVGMCEWSHLPGDQCAKNRPYRVIQHTTALFANRTFDNCQDKQSSSCDILSSYVLVFRLSIAVLALAFRSSTSTMSTLLDLEKQLRFYGAYHDNPVNVAIHIACVPSILLTGFALGTNSGPLIELPDYATVPHLELNLGTIACLMYVALYVLLEPVAGTCLSILLLLGTAGGDYLIGEYGSIANKIAIGIFVFGWIAQFVGHGKFEGRAPALLDNIFQAFFLAPLFVWLEVLFSLGYRPELQKRVNSMVRQDIAKFRAEREAKRLKAGLDRVNSNMNGKANGHAKSS